MDARGDVLTPLDEGAVEAAVQTPHAKAAKRSSSTSCTPTPIPRTSTRRRDRAPPLAERLHHPWLGRCCRISRVRARHDGRASTPPCSRSSTATSAALARDLEARGYKRDLLIMNGNGGTVAATTRRQRRRQDGDERPGIRRHGRGRDARRSPVSPTPSPTTWAAPRPTSR